jgi:7-cyano-7-deazaguanine synthase
MSPRTTPGKAVVLLSGGVDSATALAMAKAGGHECYAITFDYHQRHARELASASMVASATGVANHLSVDFDLRDIGGSALTAEIDVPKGERGQEKGVRSNNQGGNSSRFTPHASPIPITYVPARNTIFLSFALGWAEVLEAESIFIGANAIDYSGYPDCRPEYLRAFERMANLATRASVEGRLRFRIKAPLVSMTKAEIIRKGLDLGVDYGLTWSCYDPQMKKEWGKASGGGRKQQAQNTALLSSHEQFVPCGRCDSCRLRDKGFREAGIKDPLLS